MSLIIPRNFKCANALDTTDAHGTTDAKFQKGDKVRVWQYPVYGKLGEVVEATYGGMEYTVNVEGKDYPRIDYRRIVKVSNAAGDSAAGDSNDDSILRLCKPSNVIKKAKMGNLHEVRYGAGYIYPLIGRDKVLLKVFGSLSEANKSPLVAAADFGEKEIVNDACDAMDAQFKIGDTVKLSKSHPRNPGKEGKVVQVFPTGFVKVKFDDGSTDIELEKNVTANSRAADACGMDAKFKVGDKVQRGNQIGIVKDIEKEPYIEVKFKDEPITLFVHERELKISNSRAGD